MMASPFLDEARAHALDILRQCAGPLGYKASGQERGYPHVWARDSAIIALGAVASGEADLIAAVRASLGTLARHQSELGLIPLNVAVETDTVSTENAGAVDANLWYVLTQALFATASGDDAHLEQAWPGIERAMLWLRYQDMNECGLLEVPEAGDWMDLMAVRYNVLYDNVLWYAVLRAYAGMQRRLGLNGGADGYRPRRLSPVEAETQAAGVHERINLLMWIDRCWVASHFAEQLERLKAMRLEWYMLYHSVGTISSRPYYLPFVAFREYGDFCDVLGNLLAILCGVANAERSDTILRYLYQVGAARPFPTKAIYPPIHPGHPDWREYYRSRNLNLPHQYHNGGIWPMIGGFHIAALVKMGWQREAANLLTDLAAACRLGVHADWEFNEWLHGQTGNPMGYPSQAWSAAMYIYAYEAVRTGRLPLFETVGNDA
jgi:glycogen debranching enzyme